MKHQWQLTLLWGVLVGSGTGVTSMVLAAIVATRWFETRRGLVVGALSAASATGQLIFLPVLAKLVEGQGWRSAALVVAGAAVVVFFLVFRFMRDRPEDVGLLRYGQKESAATSARADAATRGPSNCFEVSGILVPGGIVLRLRRVDQWSHRDSSDRRLPRPWDAGSSGGRTAGDDGNLRLGRHHRLGVAHRPLFAALPAFRVLHAAGASR